MGITALSLTNAAVLRPQDGLAPGLTEALDRLRVGVTLFDADERLVYANAHYNYLFRSFPPVPNLIGVNYDSLIRLEIAGGEIAKTQAADDRAFVSARRQQLQDGDFHPFDLYLADGRILELKARRTPAAGWIVLWNDATYTRKLLMRLEDTIELSADAFAFWDHDDRLTLCNTAFAELHGFVTPESAKGNRFAELIEYALKHGKFAVESLNYAAWIERRMDAHQSSAGALTLSTTSGVSYLVRERATRDGGAVTVLTDVSERRRAEAALVEQTRALQRTKRALQKTKTEAKRRATYLADLTRRLDAAEAEVDTAKSTLLRTMSHELKTPLNAIIGFADLLMASPERFGPEQIAEYAGLIHTAGGNLLRLLNQIMDLTKIAAGRYPLNRTPVALSAMLHDVRALFSNMAAAKALSFEGPYCDPDIRADADEGALMMMLSHLLENAVNYTQCGGSISLAVTREDMFVHINVIDNGPGVAQEDLLRILEPFEQLGRGPADNKSGTGLGLPLVKALAELHGGGFAVASTLGEGFTATIELPAA